MGNHKEGCRCNKKKNDSQIGATGATGPQGQTGAPGMPMPQLI